MWINLCKSGISMCSFKKTPILVTLVNIYLCLTWNSFYCFASPATNNTDYLQLFKYDQHWKATDSDQTTLPSAHVAITNVLNKPAANDHHIESDLYTLQVNHRQSKLDDIEVVYDYKCPKQHYIHPCDCLG